MSEEVVSSRQVPVGEQIQTKRESLGITRSQLASRAQVAPSIVTRVEKLKYAPGKETLEKFELALGLQPGAFSVAQQPMKDSEAGPNIRFVFPHTCISGCLIPAARMGTIPGVAFASFATKEISDRPHWYKPNPDLTIAQQETGRDKIHPYVSWKLRTLLDERKADVMFGWSGSTAGWDEVYVRYAQVAVGLSTLTCHYYFTCGDITYDDLLTHPESKIPMLYPRGHNDPVFRFKKAAEAAAEAKKKAEKAVADATSKAEKAAAKAQNNGYTCPFAFDPEVPIEVSAWEDTKVTARKLLEDKKALAFFAWEPYLSWMDAELVNENTRCVKAHPVGLVSATATFPLYSTMDIIARQDNLAAMRWLSEERRKSDGFFAKLSEQIKRMATALTQNGPELEHISKHLDMKEPDVIENLRWSTFGVRFYK